VNTWSSFSTRRINTQLSNKNNSFAFFLRSLSFDNSRTRRGYNAVMKSRSFFSVGWKSAEHKFLKCTHKIRHSIEKENVAIDHAVHKRTQHFFFTQSLLAFKCIAKKVATFHFGSCNFQPKNNISNLFSFKSLIALLISRFLPTFCLGGRLPNFQ